MIFENNDHNVTLVEFFIFRNEHLAPRHQSKKTQCLSPRNKGRGKGRKNGPWGSL